MRVDHVFRGQDLQDYQGAIIGSGELLEVEGGKGIMGGNYWEQGGRIMMGGKGDYEGGTIGSREGRVVTAITQELRTFSLWLELVLQPLVM